MFIPIIIDQTKTDLFVFSNNPIYKNWQKENQKNLADSKEDKPKKKDEKGEKKKKLEKPEKKKASKDKAPNGKE